MPILLIDSLGNKLENGSYVLIATSEGMKACRIRNACMASPSGLIDANNSGGYVGSMGMVRVAPETFTSSQIQQLNSGHCINVKTYLRNGGN